MRALERRSGSSHNLNNLDHTGRNYHAQIEWQSNCSAPLFQLTSLGPLTYGLSIEEERPEVTLTGAFVCMRPGFF